MLLCCAPNPCAEYIYAAQIRPGRLSRVARPGALDHTVRVRRYFAGPKKLTANQARSLTWLNFARSCSGLPLHRSSWATDVAAETAEALTKVRPYTVGIDSVTVQVRLATAILPSLVTLQASAVGTTTSVLLPALHLWRNRGSASKSYVSCSVH